MKTFQSEQGIRTLIDKQLENLGWNLTGGKERTVWQEQPRTEEERKKLKRGRPDYVLYSKDGSIKQPLIIIEAKSPWKNLDDALKQGYEYAQTLNAPIVFATDGIYYKTLHTKKQKPLVLNWEEVDELFRELEAIKFLQDNEVNTISKEVIYDRKQLIKIFEDSNDLLRDEWFRAWIERFWEFSNILFLKLIGELEDLKEEEWRYEEVVLEKYLRWSQWKDKRGWELLDFVNNVVLQKIGHAYKDDKIFTPLQIKNPETLKKIIDKLDPLNLINIDSDIKGDSFEYFLKQSTATKNDLGEYFTPRHIVKVMVKLLNPQIGEKIYDPFCWTGGTLIETFKHISHNMARTKTNWDQLRKNTLFGNEITTTARITKMNMILVWDGHSGIQQENSLKTPIEDKYDIVITNMPYSQKTEYGSYYDLPSNNGDSICVQHCIKAIDKASENGRMALVVPEGFLFRKDLQKTREYLLDRCTLKSVISLPQGVFLPYTGVKTNILYCTDVKKKKKQEKIWYFDVKSDGYSLDNHRRKLEGKTDLQNLLEYRNPENQDPKEILKIGFSQISMEDVKKNDLVLVGSRYKKMFDYGNIEWEILKISDISVVIRGVTYAKTDESEIETNIKILRSNNINLESNSLNLDDIKYLKENVKIENEKKLTKNDILICTSSGSKSHLGKFALINEELNSFAGGFMAIVRPNIQKILPQYLYFILNSHPYQEYINQITNGSNINNLKNSDIENFKFPIPPLKVQKEIVNELNGYQKLIEGARQIVENYKPNIDIKDEWIKKPLWQFISFTQVGLVRGAKDQSSSYLYPYLRMDAINLNGELLLEKNVFVKWTKEEFDLFSLKNWDFLFNTRNSKELVGKCAIYNWQDNKYLFNNNILRIRFTDDLLEEFLCLYLISKQWRENLSIMIKTTTNVSAIYQKDLRELIIPIPSIIEQEKIIAEIKNEQKYIEPNKEIIRIFERKIQHKLNFIWGK